MISIWNKRGNDISNVLHSGITDFYLDKVSVGLWSTATFWVIDEDLSRDLTIEATIANNSNKWGFFSKGSSNELVNITGNVKILDKVVTASANVYSISVLWSSEEFNLDETDLTIIIQNGAATISEFTIKLFSESVEPEKRLDTLLANWGLSVTEKWGKAFKETNLNEARIDHDLLNKKKTELLRDVWSIKGYLGAYSGLVNALKFFGYDDDVIIQEYWKWLDTEIDKGVWKSHDISKEYTTKELNSLKLYDRTNILSLIYNLNDYTDSTLTADSPVTELISIFSTAQTAWVKINLVKQILEEWFLPAHVYIKDVIGIKHHRITLREFDVLHDASIQYNDQSIKDSDYTIIQQTVLQNRTFLTFEPMTGSDESQTTNTSIIALRTAKSSISEGELLPVDQDDFLLDSAADFDTLTSKFVRHNTTLTQFFWSDGWEDILARVQKVTFTVVDATTDVDLLSATHYASKVDPTDEIPQWFQFSLDKVGEYWFIVSVLDYMGTAQVIRRKFTITHNNLAINIFRNVKPNSVVTDPEGVPFKTFKALREALYLSQNTNDTELEEFDMFNVGLTGSADRPVFHSEDVINYDFENYPSITGDALWYTNQLQKLYLSTPTIWEMRNHRISRTSRNRIQLYNASYLFAYWDIAGSLNETKTFDFELGIKWETLSSLAINYDSTQSQYGQIAEVATMLNTSSDDNFSQWDWFVKGIKWDNGDGTFEERFCLCGVTKELDSHIRWDISANTLSNAPAQMYKHITYSDVNPTVWISSEQFSSTISASTVTLELDDVTDVSNAAFDNLQSFVDWIIANKSDTLDVYVTETDISNQALHIVITAKDAKHLALSHASFGKVQDNFREASVDAFAKTKLGADWSVDEPFIISVDKEQSYVPYDVEWTITDDNGVIIDISTDAVLKHWTVLDKHDRKADWTISATWNDKYGNSYSDTWQSAILINARLVDAKYETFTDSATRDSDRRFSDRLMWHLMGSKPKWYLPLDINTLGTEGGGSSAGMWILSTGLWNDAGIWIDTELWSTT